MQREDVERLAQQADALLEMDAKGALVPHGVGGLARSVISQQTAALRALLADRDALREAIFGGANYATDLTNGNFIEMAQTTESARLGALARAGKAEAERDAAFAAGQRDMRERAAKKCQWHSDRLVETIRALPIKPRP